MGKGDTIKIDAVAVVRSATAPANLNVLWWDTAAGGNTLNNKIKVYSTQSGKWETIDGTSKTGADLLEEIKKVGGSGSGLDADTVDGFHASAFVKSSDGFIRQTGAEIYGAAQGTDTYTVTLGPTLASYKAGMSFNIKFANGNTGAATLNVDGLGAKAIVKKDGTALVSGDIPAGSINNVIYDGTSFQLGAAIASVSNTLQDVITAGSTFSGTTTSVSYDHNNTSKRTQFAWNNQYWDIKVSDVGTGTNGRVSIQDTSSSFLWSDGTNDKSINFNATNITITDTVSSKGVVYAADYSANFVARSLIDKGYVDTNYANVFLLNGTDAYYNAGNVGIGTDTPTTKFHIYEDTNAVNLLVESTTTENAVLTLRHSATGGSGDENSVIVYQEDSTTHWTEGLNGKSGGTVDEYVLANGTSLDANWAFRMSKAGNAEFRYNLSSEGQMTPKIQATKTPTGTTETIDWNDGNFAVIDLGSATGDVTLTLSNPVAGAPYFIKFIQGATFRNVIFPSSVKVAGGTAPYTFDVTETDDAIDIMALAYDESSQYLANVSQNHA